MDRKMRILIFSLVAFMSISFSQSSMDKVTPQLERLVQEASMDEELLVWIFFTDKGDATQQYFEKPISLVSEKSLKRRSKVLSDDNLVSQMDLPVYQKYIEQVQSLGLKLKQKTKWFNGISGWATKTELIQIANLQFVKQLDIVYRFRKDNFEEKSLNNNPQEIKHIISKPEGINSFNYGQSFTQLNQITVTDVHNLGYTGQGITICSMDAGFDNLSHEVFSSMNIIAMWDFVDNDPDVSQGGSHGTSTLSTLGGFKEGKLIGPAFDSDYILARTENIYSETPVEEDNWIAALEWADSIGVDVTSTSLTYLEFDPPFQSYTWEDMDGNTMRITIAADLAVKVGIFVVNSASNEGFHPTHNTLWGPADGDSVVAVGAVDGSGVRANFSSVGPTVDGRIKPDLMAMGEDVYVARSSSSTSYGYSNGTSFSCPILAGASALLLEIDPSLTPIQLRELLKNTASQSSNPDRLMGWGIVNTLVAAQSLLTNTNETELPDDFVLLRNYPNPFNPSTKIQFAVPKQSNVKLTLYNILGGELKELFNSEVEAGIHEFVLDGSELSSGVYLVRMFTENTKRTIKISLLK
jgi:subtilisin family serine protease